MTDTVVRAMECFRLGQHEEAELFCRRALACEPDNELALRLHADLAQRKGRHREEIDCLERLLKLAPGDAALHSNLGVALNKMRRGEEAMAHLHEAMRLRPDFPQAHNNLGAVLEGLDRLEEAEAAYRRAIQIKEDYAGAHHHLGMLLLRRGRLAEAIAEHRRSVELREDFVEAYWGLATAFCEIGELDEAIDCHRKAVELRPGSAQALSNLLFVLHYHPRTSAEELFDGHVEWGRRHADPLRGAIRPHGNDPTPDRRLRVGYVSCDFRYHPVSRFFEPILASHDRERFGIYCYSSVAEPDLMTRRLRGYGDEWRNIYRMSDEAVANTIRKDRIDILVDLMGHIGGNRLLIFARKPAPVQVSYLGYPDTTGMSAMDYRITDSLHDPAGQSEMYHTEQLLRLDPCAWCWRPDEDAPEVSELPALATGRITFAALNKLIKASPVILALWSRILEALPGSRLKILADHPEDPGVYGLFERNGIGRERLIIAGRMPRLEYLREYESCDIALDSFPYNGHTTTCDALWMGVPVVSLAGKTHVQRAGLSVLTAVGLGEEATQRRSDGATRGGEEDESNGWRLVARSGEEYVEKAVGLAMDLARLAELRRGMRERMRSSVLMDERGFTARLEEIYRSVWKKWCASAEAEVARGAGGSEGEQQGGLEAWLP